jgi:alpha-tubulin suppressor-like RCC1 family protein
MLAAAIDPYSWGMGDVGQLGHGAVTDRALPGAISGLGEVVAIAGASWHGLALKADGSVWSWGGNNQGELGYGTPTTTCDHPENTEPWPCGLTAAQVSGVGGVADIAAGGSHSLALKPDGTVWSWGRNASGELGDGTEVGRTTPAAVGGFGGVTAISAAGHHVVALKADGTVWAWGHNRYGQMGMAPSTQTCGSGSAADPCSTRPVQVGGLGGVVAVAAGAWHNLALRGDGTVWAWGRNNDGQLGHTSSSTNGGCRTEGGSSEPCSVSPIQVRGPGGSGTLGGVIAIAAGRYHSVAVKADGTVWAALSWGP